MPALVSCGDYTVRCDEEDSEAVTHVGQKRAVIINSVCRTEEGQGVGIMTTDCVLL